MRRALAALLAALTLPAPALAALERAKPLMGTDSRPALANGNAYPAIAVACGHSVADLVRRGRAPLVPLRGNDGIR